MDTARLASRHMVIEPIRELNGGVTLGWLHTGIGRVAAIRYPDGTTITPADWQSQQPNLLNNDDIADTEWITRDGHFCIILNGLPRAFWAAWA